MKARHGIAILYDCHSIRSDIPFLFEGKLPDFNIGTDGGRTLRRAQSSRLSSCNPCAAARVIPASSMGASRAAGRRGTTASRNAGVHAIQMELAQSTHLAAEAPPLAYDAAKAERLRIHLKDILIAD